MGDRRNYERRKDAKDEKLQSIQMMSRDWLKILFTRNNWLEEAKE
ncbi:hypothetical protein ACFL0D_04920 [Thermoproteota archaeon]